MKIIQKAKKTEVTMRVTCNECEAKLEINARDMKQETIVTFLVVHYILSHVRVAMKRFFSIIVRFLNVCVEKSYNAYKSLKMA